MVPPKLTLFLLNARSLLGKNGSSSSGNILFKVRLPTDQRDLAQWWQSRRRSFHLWITNIHENLLILAWGPLSRVCPKFTTWTPFAEIRELIASKMQYGLGLTLVTRTSRWDACTVHKAHVGTISCPLLTQLTIVPSYQDPKSLRKSAFFQAFAGQPSLFLTVRFLSLLMFSR